MTVILQSRPLQRRLFLYLKQEAYVIFLKNIGESECIKEVVCVKR